jgi:pyruvate/2-oxoglutarate dehydrogenase complex dihydrolipoamide acyltransferase (E2) component
MSDALLERIATAAEGLLAHIRSTGTGAGAVNTKPTTPPKAETKADKAETKADANAVAADTTKTPAQKKAEADKLIAQKKAVKEAADRAAAASAAKASKPTGGKRTIEQVREMIRKVAADVDKQSAKDILMDDGGGVEKVLDLKPENYDKVYEACEVLLSGEGAKTAPVPDDDDDFA